MKKNRYKRNKERLFERVQMRILEWNKGKGRISGERCVLVYVVPRREISSSPVVPLHWLQTVVFTAWKSIGIGNEGTRMGQKHQGDSRSVAGICE